MRSIVRFAATARKGKSQFVLCRQIPFQLGMQVNKVRETCYWTGDGNGRVYQIKDPSRLFTLPEVSSLKAKAECNRSALAVI